MTDTAVAANAQPVNIEIVVFQRSGRFGAEIRQGYFTWHTVWGRKKESEESVTARALQTVDALKTIGRIPW